jgi:hypothetical protein
LYIDPGTGSVIVQAIIATVLFLGVFIKLFWSKIRLLFVKKEAAKPNNKQDED